MIKTKYTLRDSPFFRLRTKKKLAKLLQVSPQKLTKLANLENGYVHFQKPKKNREGMRDISAPIPPLKSVQRRIANLLNRIETKDYLFAPVSGRSYVDNAAHHIGSNAIRLLDIEDFFPSCTIRKVIWFFKSKMECSPDVAVILAHIATNNGALPQGSPCSPILAYFAYIDMWTEIEAITNAADCKLSVYADDLTISGKVVPEHSIWEIKQCLYRHGHSYAAEKERAHINKPVKITGVILTPSGLTVRNQQRKQLHDVQQELQKAKHPKVQQKLAAQMRGRFAQFQQVMAGNKSPSIPHNPV
ncbi:MAG: reverse transcriptase family protein [Planktomarina sp.]